MHSKKYYMYLDEDERKLLVRSLIDFRNDLIAERRYTDVTDELLIKISKAKRKRVKVIYREG